jgi:hypothetical protein
VKYIALALLLAALGGMARAQGGDVIRIVERRTVELRSPVGGETRSLELTLVEMRGSGWSPQAILGAGRQAAGILAQCGLAVARAELVTVEAPERYRWLDTPYSRRLASVLQLAKPTVYFVADTRQQPAFDAEAIGRGNSRSRPELADTVWLTRGIADPGVALAHELAHVLMDSGAHSQEPGNLMQDRTAPENARLSPAQCERLRDTAAQNGLLRR